jgi:hypothetical protein
MAGVRVARIRPTATDVIPSRSVGIHTSWKLFLENSNLDKSVSITSGVSSPESPSEPPSAPSLFQKGTTRRGKPDFSGVWRISLPVGYLINLAADLEAADVQSWAAALFAERIAHFGKDDPGLGCLPLGPRHITGGGRAGMAKIIQTPAMIAVLYEDLAYRQVFMDGRSLPRDPFPSFMVTRRRRVRHARDASTF